MKKNKTEKMSGQKTRPLIKLNSYPEEQIDSNNLVDSRYECPICIYWLDEPVLTSCGHRFCRNCIDSWLRNQNNCCPLDNKPLSIKNDIFPDLYTKREIDQMKNPCPNVNSGCQVSVSPLEMEKHLLDCEFQLRTLQYECPFNRLNCKFVGKTKPELNSHIRNEMTSHLSFLIERLDRSKIFSDNIDTLWDAPNKTAMIQQNGSAQVDENLIKAMYERIVVLEQKSREQESKIEKLTKELGNFCKKSDVQTRYSNGIIIWEINNFVNKIDTMINNPNVLYYSSQSYTSPFGYKFCARINISPKTKDFLSFHVHMMQSENDLHLDWPFNGKIKISMIHPKDQHFSQHDTLMSNPEILSFHRPTEEISPRGFGYLEYARIPDIFSKGFVVNDKLILKIQMNIV